VGDLTVPDPRVTNPELFDLRNPDAPIPQFVNAMKNGGIDVSAEQIAQGITYVSTKADGAPLIDKDGNPFVVAVYNLDPFLFPENYRDLAGPIPLMIAEKGENEEFKWKNPKQYELFNLAGIRYLGALIENGEFPNMIQQFNLQLFSTVFRSNSAELENSDETTYRLRVGQENNIPHGYITGELCGLEDSSNLSQEELTNLIQKRMTPINPRQIPVFIVTNETHEGNFSDRRLRLCYEIATSNKPPDGKLIFSDTDNHYSSGMWTQYTKERLKVVKDLVDIVGVQAHVAQWDWQIPKLPTNNDIASTLKSFGKPVWVMEFDVSDKYLPGNSQQRLLEQSKIAYMHILGFLQSEVVKAINLWSIPEYQGTPNKGKTPFDFQGRPKLFFYAMNKAVLDYLLLK